MIRVIFFCFHSCVYAQSGRVSSLTCDWAEGDQNLRDRLYKFRKVTWKKFWYPSNILITVKRKPTFKIGQLINTSFPLSASTNFKLGVTWPLRRLGLKVLPSKKVLSAICRLEIICIKRADDENFICFVNLKQEGLKSGQVVTLLPSLLSFWLVKLRKILNSRIFLALLNLKIAENSLSIMSKLFLSLNLDII